MIVINLVTTKGSAKWELLINKPASAVWYWPQTSKKDRLINGTHSLPCLSGYYCQWSPQKCPWKRQRQVRAQNKASGGQHFKSIFVCNSGQLQKFVNYISKKFYNIGPRPRVQPWLHNQIVFVLCLLLAPSDGSGLSPSPKFGLGHIIRTKARAQGLCSGLSPTFSLIQ